MTDISSIASLYQNSDYAQFEQQHFPATSNGTEVFFVKQGNVSTTDPSISQLAFGAYTRLDGRFRGRCNHGDSWFDMSHAQAGDVLLGPANTTSEYEFEGQQEIIIVASPVIRLSNAFEIEVRDIENAQGAYDSFFNSNPTRDFNSTNRMGDRMKSSFDLLKSVWHAAENPTVGSALFIDTAYVSVAAQLFGDFLPEKHRTAHKISDVRLKRVVEFIEANLNHSLSLDQLSDIACMSSAHFARAFKLALREPPHAYVLRRRVEKAKDLLRYSAIPIAFVAHECGFSSQAHLTEHFRTRVGTSPAQFRKAHAL
jgi:AraC-like DNA-binding protein